VQFTVVGLAWLMDTGSLPRAREPELRSTRNVHSFAAPHKHRSRELLLQGSRKLLLRFSIVPTKRPTLQRSEGSDGGGLQDDPRPARPRR